MEPQAGEFSRRRVPWLAPLRLSSALSQGIMLFQSLRRFTGIDRSVGLVILSRVWTLWAGPVTLFCITRFLSPVEQGFYYTFNSIIGLNIFLEMGLSLVLMQFASHEMAELSWTSRDTLAGSEINKRRLAAIFRQSLRWYSFAAILVSITTLPAGMYFFARTAGAESASWRGPWICLSLLSAMNLCLIPLFALFEGVGKVSTVVLIRVLQGIAAGFMLWLALALDFSLFAGPLYQVTSVAVAAICFWSFFRRCLLDLFRVDHGLADFSWRREVWPLQWKIAISCLSSYFVVQLFNPVLFANHGPIAAGKMGMSITLIGVIQGTCNAWVVTKSATFGIFIAREQFEELDRVFFRALVQSSCFFALGALVLFLSLIYLRNHGYSFANRVLEPLPLFLLICGGFIQSFVNSQATYLRAHKQEPFLWITLAGGAVVGLSTLLLGPPFGATGILSGYVLGSLTIGGASTYVFFRKRQEWHTLSDVAAQVRQSENDSRS